MGKSQCFFNMSYCMILYIMLCYMMRCCVLWNKIHITHTVRVWTGTNKLNSSILSSSIKRKFVCFEWIWNIFHINSKQTNIPYLSHDNACIRSNISITYFFICNVCNITWPHHYVCIHPRMFTKWLRTCIR